MTEFARRTAVVTGGGSGMGRELVRQLVAELRRRNVRCLADRPGGNAKALRGGGVALRAARSRRTSPMSPKGRRLSGLAMRLPTVTRSTRSTCCSTTPVSAAAAAWLPIAVTNGNARSTSAGVVSITASARFCQCCKTPRRATSSIPAASTVFGRRSGHASRIPPIRPRNSRSRVYRGADHRPADQRAAYQMLGRHARPDRNLHPRQRAKIHSSDRESNAIDAPLAQARERFALVGRDAQPIGRSVAQSRVRAGAAFFSR